MEVMPRTERKGGGGDGRFIVEMHCHWNLERDGSGTVCDVLVVI